MLHATEAETSDAFLEIVLGDRELLTAEFEAIVSGAWPPHPWRPLPAFPPRRPARSEVAEWAHESPVGRPAPTGRTPRRRERGPPH